MDFGCVLLTDVGVGLGPCPFGPVASHPPLGIGLLRQPCGDSFHLGVFSCVGLPRLGGLLVALPEVRLPGLGCKFTFRVPQILCLVPLRGCGRISGFWLAVRVLLLASPLTLGLVLSMAPGWFLAVGARWGSSGHPKYVFSF